jgi:hypothetical protein
VPRDVLQLLVPPEVQVQQFDGTSWVGLVPFRMEGIAPRGVPDLPWLSAFPELNLRLYVDVGGKPGVWFLSLDAGNPLAVWAARRLFHLPYFHSRMRLDTQGDGAVSYRSFRLRRPRGLEFHASYGPIAAPARAAPGTLEHWLTERYCLYAMSPRGELFRSEVHHQPWPLQAAQGEIIRNDLLLPHGIEFSGQPLLHFARRLDVVVWSPRRVAP